MIKSLRLPWKHSEMGSTDLAKNLLKKLHKYFPGSKILKQWDELLK